MNIFFNLFCRLQIFLIRCEKSVQYLPTVCQKHLPLVNITNHPLENLSRCRFYVRVPKQSTHYLVSYYYIFITFFLFRLSIYIHSLTHIMKEEFEDTKVVIRIRISKKNRQHNGQKQMCERTNNDLQNIHMKLKKRRYKQWW